MRILIATGGVSPSEAAVRLGGHLHQMAGGTLTLLTVIRHEEERAQAEALLARAQSFPGDGSETAQTCIRTGQPGGEIVREAEAGPYDLVIVGERIPAALPRLLGQTVQWVIAHLPCPLLIARGEPRWLNRVLVCESGRDPSLINRLIVRLSLLLEQVDELTVLHVMSQIAAGPGVPGWALRADAQELMEKHSPEGDLLEEDLARLSALNVRLKAKVRHGLVVREILDEARSGDYDLVVIGAHESTGWERYLLDDLAQKIIHDVDRSLLIV